MVAASVDGAGEIDLATHATTGLDVTERAAA